MPEYQSKLWYLFALLAQLQQGRFACSRLHELRDPVKHTPVLLSHANLGVRLYVVRGAAGHDAVAGDSCSVVARDTLVVLLLGLCGGGGGGGSLRLSLRLRGLRLRLKLAMLSYMVVGVLMVTLRPLARVVLRLLLLREVVLHLLHLSRRSMGLSSVLR